MLLFALREILRGCILCSKVLLFALREKFYLELMGAGKWIDTADLEDSDVEVASEHEEDQQHRRARRAPRGEGLVADCGGEEERAEAGAGHGQLLRLSARGPKVSQGGQQGERRQRRTRGGGLWRTAASWTKIR